MGKTKGPYKEEFQKGSKVKIADRAFLEDFVRTWKFHHKLEPDQLSFADKIARVKSVAFYHGGDELYELYGVPGIWHEHCLEFARNKDGPANSRRAAREFLWETLLYGSVMFLLLALIRWSLKVSFADNLFEVWIVSTVVFGPIAWAVKHLVTDGFKW